MEDKLSKTELFIRRGNAAHNNKFDYSLVEYKNTHTKVKILCPEHGIFEQRPMDHVRGIGCQQCSGKGISLTQDVVVDRIKSVHGDLYDISLVEYQANDKPVTLICKEHGEFQITPKSVFLQNAGCNKCAYHDRGTSRRKTVEQFITEATAIHGDRYDYSQVTEYKNSNTKVPIICREHGIFHQAPDNHINKKQGCPLCNTGSGKGGYSHSYFQHNPEEQNIPGILYAARFTNGTERFIKIGITAKTTHHRFSRSEYKQMTVEVIHERFMPLYEAFCIEQATLESLKQHRFFTNTPFSGHTECFRVTPEVLTVVQEVFINNG